LPLALFPQSILLMATWENCFWHLLLENKNQVLQNISLHFCSLRILVLTHSTFTSEFLQREAPTIEALPVAPALTYAHVPGSIPNQLQQVYTWLRNLTQTYRVVISCHKLPTQLPAVDGCWCHTLTNTLSFYQKNGSDGKTQPWCWLSQQKPRIEGEDQGYQKERGT
jgi:hypothetical protein